MANRRVKPYSPSFRTLASLVIGSFLSLCLALFGFYLGSRAYEANNPGAASDMKTRFSTSCQDTNNP